MDIQADVQNISKIPIIPNLLQVICQTTGMGFAAVARVTDDKWVACSVRDEILFGLVPGGELELKTTICNEIRDHHHPVVIDHVANDPEYSTHHTPLKYGFQSYISVPIFRKDGTFFGTLCAIDPNPHRLNSPEILGLFTLFADLISFHLQAVELVTTSESTLRNEKENAESREQYIAIVGHDLRNPLSAITFSAEMLLDMPLESEASSLVAIIQKSAGRMNGLIRNMMDFARGRMGEGLIVNRSRTEPIEPVLRHIIDEHLTINPGYRIETDFRIQKNVYCDSSRIAELFSNLLGNAIAYGDSLSPIRVTASVCDAHFVLSVTNTGETIPANLRERLFQPFARGKSKSGKDGLGLGLYIASEIARAHEGIVTVQSENNETTFTLRIPSPDIQ